MKKNLYREFVTKILQSQGKITEDLDEDFWQSMQKASGISENITEEEVIEECFKMMRAAAIKKGCPPDIIEEDLRRFSKIFVTISLLSRLEEEYYFKFFEMYLSAKSDSEFFTTRQKLLWEMFIQMDCVKEEMRKHGANV